MRPWGAKKRTLRSKAAELLQSVKPANEEERSRREQLMLGFINTPLEDYTMRLLATCGGAQSIRALTPLLDGQNFSRALYAAWCWRNCRMPGRQCGQTTAGTQQSVQYISRAAKRRRQFPGGPEPVLGPGTNNLNGPLRNDFSSLRLDSSELRPQHLTPAEAQFLTLAYRQSRTAHAQRPDNSGLT